mmetsp:Transcript_29129/g.51030  ORF Transcript_29129/g.51030 Transcript_29129/m.51030 type:complete len:285 (-) Transcript_29129:463-1317(-)
MRLVASVSVLVCERTVLARWRAIVVVVHPYVARVLHTALHGDGLVSGPRLVDVRVAVHHGGPDHRIAFDGGHSDAEVVEPCAAPCLRRAQVHEESVHSRALRREEARVLVVMRAVELAFLVAEHLERLEVSHGRADEVGDPSGDGLGDRVSVARVLGAPALEAGAHGGERVAREAALEVVRARVDEGVGLGVVEEAVERDDPRRVGLRVRRLRERARRVGGEVAQQPAHRLAHTSRRHRRAALRAVARAPLRLAHGARGGARALHEAGVGGALAARRPVRAGGV